MMGILKQVMDHFAAVIAGERMKKDEVAVELMCEQDFDTAVELAYQSGEMKVGPLEVVIKEIKNQLDLFRPVEPPKREPGRYRHGTIDPDVLADVVGQLEVEAKRQRRVRAKFDEESG